MHRATTSLGTAASAAQAACTPSRGGWMTSSMSQGTAWGLLRWRRPSHRMAHASRLPLSGDSKEHLGHEDIHY